MKITDFRTTVVGTPWRELTFAELLTYDGRDALSAAAVAVWP